MHGKRIGLTLAATLLSLAACNDSTAPAPSADFLALTDESVPLFGVGPEGTTPGAPCQYSDGAFTCPPQTHNGLTFTMSFALFDAAGTAQQKFDPTTTASRRTSTTISGTLQHPAGTGRLSSTINRSGTMTVSGLAGAETTHILNGTESGTIVSTGKGPANEPITISSTIADTAKGLVLPVGQNLTNRWPLAGTRIHTSTTTVSRSGGAPGTPMQTRITETYDGTSIVHITITTPFGTRNCTRDMSQRAGMPICTP